MRFKKRLHPWFDPALSLPDHWRATWALAGLPDGDYCADVQVPYYAQFASPERIHDYIHAGYDGTQDPDWQVFGATDPAEYAFWSPRVCTLACIKMAVEAFHPDLQPSLWDLVKAGLDVNGYTLRDKHGNWIDEGWYFHAQVILASRYELQAVGRAYVSPLRICDYIRNGWLVAATVSPELGERQPSRRHYGGHLVLVYGFAWENGRPARYYLHNPSGRYPELQAHAAIPSERFNAQFAHKLVALRPK
jgi:hypothetical protein